MQEEEKTLDVTNVNELKEQWAELGLYRRKQYFFDLPRADAEELFLSLSSDQQIELIDELKLFERRSWLRLLPMDDAADFIQSLPEEKRFEALSLLDDHSRREVKGLLAYAEDDAGGLMNPRYIRLRADITVDEAVGYLRAQAKTPIEIIYYAYVLDSAQKLVGVLSFRDLLLARPERSIREIMQKDFVSVPEDMDGEEVARLFTQHNLMAIPVVTHEGVMKGMVTYDDIASVVEKEATEDIHKLGGMEALDSPYFKVGFLEMLKKRSGWLIVLFFAQLLTATAMGFFEKQLESAIVLALFIPLIISSGGNSGSQASTLIIRSLALREIRLRDWMKVLSRELATGVSLGLILGLFGLLRIILWQKMTPVYGDHYILLGFTVGLSLVGVVIWGTIVGAMLPFALRKLGFDPASASAPLVATLVDITGLVIYFSLASFFLSRALI